MKRTIIGLAGLVATGLVVSGCSTPEPGPLDSRYFGTPAPAPSAVAAAEPTATGTEAAGSPAATPTTSSSPTPSTHPTDSPKAGKPTGPITDQPFEVDGIPIVSKDHRLSAKYVPAWSKQPDGIHPDAMAAFKKLRAAAKKEGLAFSIRSGYRSYNEQRASFAKAMKDYDEKTARLYFAEAGASEHQLGLALDVWDGKNRGTAFTRTKHAPWLAEHAHEFGFIIRYPDGKTHITGYAWESWHLRWVGLDISKDFEPGSGLTLEEYLGLS